MISRYHCALLFSCRLWVASGSLFLFTTVGLAQSITRDPDGRGITITQRLAIRSDTESLEIDSVFGPVDLVATDMDVVVLIEAVRVRTRNNAEAERIGSDYASSIEKRRKRVRIRGMNNEDARRAMRVEYPGDLRIIVTVSEGGLRSQGARNEVELSSGYGDIEVIDAHTRMDLSTGYGSIDISDSDGGGRIRAGAGDVTVLSFQGDLEIVSGAGEIDIRKANGDIEVNTGGGDITADRVRGSVQLSTAGGSIRVVGLEGNAVAATSGGDIELFDIRGDVRARTSGGDIEGSRISGTVYVETQAGDIDFREVTHDLHAETHVGDVRVDVSDAGFLEGEGGMEVRAQNGNIRLRLPPVARATFYLDLGVDGRLLTRGLSVPMEMTRIRRNARGERLRSAVGKMNGGGGVIELRTESGFIRISDSESH